MITRKTVLLLLACVFLAEELHSQRTVLNLSRRGLKEIPAYVFDQTDLKVLKLYGNDLDSISTRIGELVNLEKLYLGKNNIHSLPMEIGNLKKLRILSVSNNRLDSLPSSLGVMSDLEQLWLDNNQLRTLPTGIGQLKRLQTLQLRYNWMDSLPESIGNCEDLQFVFLNRNNLNALPGTIGNLRRLRELYLSGAGQALEVPQELCKLRNLEVLEIDGNMILPACIFVIQTTRLRIIQH